MFQFLNSLSPGAALGSVPPQLLVPYVPFQSFACCVQIRVKVPLLRCDAPRDRAKLFASINSLALECCFFRPELLDVPAGSRNRKHPRRFSASPETSRTRSRTSPCLSRRPSCVRDCSTLTSAAQRIDNCGGVAVDDSQIGTHCGIGRLLALFPLLERSRAERESAGELSL